MLLALMLMTSCATSGNNDSVTCSLYYYADELQDSMSAKKITLDKAPSSELAEKLFSLLSSPESKKSLPILTPDIKLEDVQTKNIECILTLSSRYLEIPEQKRAEINACITHTMCSLPDIEQVTLNCEEKTLTFTSDDFITSSPRTHHNMYTANLYFASESGDMLTKEERTVSLESENSLEYLVLTELIIGPSDIPAKRLLSEKIKINNVEVNEGTCIIDLSPEFISSSSHTELTEQLTVYSIVNTMTELPLINSVRFLINGNAGYGFEFIDISKPLTNKSEFSPK